MWNPKHAARLARQMWARSMNAAGIIHTRKDMVVVLRDQDE
jgi:hypothetical protein